MTLELVSIVRGTEAPIGEGITRPMKCLVRLPDNSVRSAIVKQLSPEGVAVEAFCALLLKGWGLSVPDAAIVESPLSYVSMDTSYPNMKQKIGWSESLPDEVKIVLQRRGAELVSRFSETPLALAADEAIENRDRHFGNILWDGQNVAWIDHGCCLGVTNMPDMNKLAVIAQLSSNRRNVQSAALSIAMTLAPKCIQDAESIGSNHFKTDQFAARVANSLTKLSDAILKRFPSPPGH